jgi:hypothetical protein
MYSHFLRNYEVVLANSKELVMRSEALMAGTIESGLLSSEMLSLTVS